MQLRKLTIHNIASIEDAVIDFSGTELGKAPIFLICGETGAGKTTILDSICLALYGDTPRMTSVSKEELELTEPSDSRIERYYSNDNSQLLHRGAGEGFSKLLFTGNDDKDYEAVWEVHRAHNKAHKRLLRPTRTLTATDGSYSENRINEIKNKVIELTGLEYDQFCRTVMLAQGEFTKFLKSNKSEKSEILEKLTGTEIYSRLGIKIAEHYNTAKSYWQQLKSEIDRIRLLDDDVLKSMEVRREEIKTEVEALSDERGKTVDKLAWLSVATKNNENKEKITKDILLLEKSVHSESFGQDKALVRDFEASGEGRSILENLKKNEIEIKKKQENIPGLQIAEEKAALTEKEADEKNKQFEKVISDLEQELEKIDVDALSKNYHELVTRDTLLSELLTQAEKLKGEENALSILLAQNRDLRVRKEENRKKAESLKDPVADAESELKEWTEKLNRAEVSISEMVKDIRSRLHIGDSCPVCGTTIDNEISDSHFESLLTPLREAREKAEVTYISLKSNEEAARKLIDSDEKSIKKLETKIKKANASLSVTKQATEEMKHKVGFETFSDEEILKTCKKERESLSKDISSVREKQKEADNIQKEQKKLRKKLKEATSDLEKAKEKVTQIRLSLKEATTELKALENTRDGMWESLRVFFINNPEVSMPRLTLLGSYSNQDIQILKGRIEAAEDKLKTEKGKLEAIDAQIVSHETIRPDFDDSDTKENLEKRRDSIESSVKKLSEETGAIGEALERDKILREEVVAKQKRLDEAREDLDKWEGLYNRLGDLKGVKFRAIAQSFILRSLLDNANVYMQSFNDRYTLTCNAGTLAILVKDSYKPSEPQPASILSGGESFMASLSLALALSNLRSGGMAVDILFIDEGFGTLSAEYLGNVMDTLEKLHQIGGRKVGLISHVSEMKERIPVQIRVKRESPALSRVEVAEYY